MPAKPLTDLQKEDAERLRKAWAEYKLKKPGATQEALAHECGWKTQAAVSQYMLGRIPLNADALIKICSIIGCDPWRISPSIMQQLSDMNAAANRPTLLIAAEKNPNFWKWPFATVEEDDWLQLTPEQRDNFELQILLTAKHQREAKRSRAA